MRIDPITMNTNYKKNVPSKISNFKGSVDYSGLESILKKNNYDMMNNQWLSNIRKRIEYLMKSFSKETKLVFEYNAKELAYYPNGTIMEEPYYFEIYNVILENPNSEYKHILPNFKIFNNPSPENYPSNFFEIYEKWSTLVTGFSLNDVLSCLRLPTPRNFVAFNALPQGFPDNDIKRFQDLLNSISRTNPCSVEDKFYEKRKEGVPASTFNISYEKQLSLEQK